MEDVQVLAAADVSKSGRSKARSYGVKNLYEDYNEMFKSHPDLDAVIISVPNFLHLPCIQSALEAGFNVFTEKPLANNVKECQQILNQVGKSGRQLMVGHNCRFYEAMEKMKQSLSDGFIGDLQVILAEEVINGPFAHPYVPTPVAEWWFDPKKAGGGVLLDIGYHMIDLFRFFAGDAEVLYSFLGYRFGLPVEDHAIAILHSRSANTKGIIDVGWYQRTIFPRFNFRVILNGNAGYVSSEELVPKNMYTFAAKEGAKNLLRRMVRKKIKPLRYTYFYESFYKELKHFFDCLQTDCDPLVSAEDGLRTIEIIEDAYKKGKASE
jgi:predicted dehydrogenase